MKFPRLLLVGISVLALMLFVGLGSDTYAQGRGGGRGGGGGMGGSMGGGRPTMSPGVDRGIDMSSDRSMGRSDTGRGTASSRSNGRSDNGINTARNAGDNRSLHGDAPSNNELPRFNGISKKLGTTPGALRSAYQVALAANPDLKFGQFVSANVVAANLHRRFPNVTTSAILLGIQNDRSLGQTLRDLGVGSDAAKTAIKNAKEEIRDSADH